MRSFVILILFVILQASALDVRVDKEKIRLKIQDHLPDVQSCYKNSTAQRHKIRGKVVVDFEINDRGSVAKATVNEKSTTFEDKDVQNCITKAFKSWKFPEAPKGNKVDVSFPFVFSS